MRVKSKRKMKKIMSLLMKREIEKILLFGRNLKKMNLNMNPLGGSVDRVGILSALLCVLVFSLVELIFIPEEKILSFHIMTMRSLRPKLTL